MFTSEPNVVRFGRQRSVVQGFAQRTPAIARRAIDVEARLPVEIAQVFTIVGRELPQILGQHPRAPEAGDVDVRVLRDEARVVGTAVHYGHHVVGHGGEQFLRDVVGTARVLKGKVETVAGAQHFVAPAAVFALVRTALAVYIDRDVFRQLLGVPFSPAQRVAVGYEPGDGAVFGRQVESSWTGASATLFTGADRFQQPVRIAADDIGIAAVGHGPVEEIAGEPFESLEARVRRRLVVEEDEPLVRRSAAGQIGHIQVPGVKDDGVALVQQRPVAGRFAVAPAATRLAERLPTYSEIQVFFIEICRPEQNQLRRFGGQTFLYR